MKYAIDFKRKVVAAMEDANSIQEKKDILEYYGVGRTTYRNWKIRWTQTGDVREDRGGRPRVDFRRMLREELRDALPGAIRDALKEDGCLCRCKTKVDGG